MVAWHSTDAESSGKSYMANQPYDKFAKLDKDDAKRIDKAFRIIEAFREIHPKMPTSYAQGFLAVAKNPGQGPTEYAKMLGTLQPIASRILLEIGIKSRGREDDGLDLVDRETDKQNLRQQRYYLTPKGKILLQEILKVLDDC